MSIKIPVFATLLTVIGVSVLCALGTWQLQRLEWKTALIAELEAEYQKDPMQHRITREELYNGDLQNKRGYVQGSFDQDREFLLRPRTHDGEPGYHAYIPFTTTDGAILLVNRGYVPLDWPGYMTPPSGRQNIAGMFRRPDAPNPFTPVNTPETDSWYRVDLNAMGENLAPYVLYEEQKPEEGTYPIPYRPGTHLNNNHLQYAVFWFFLAGAMVLIYSLRFLRKPQD